MKRILLCLLLVGCAQSDVDVEPAVSWWKPVSSKPIKLHWQLSTPFSYPRDVVSGALVYDLDHEDTTQQVVTQLHSLGAKTICYVSVGTYENFRSDASSFPPSILGRYNGWVGEKWLDIRRQDILIPIMRKRFINCANKGFDAIEPDNIDGWENSSGFPLTRAQGLSYIHAIADLAHSLNLSVGLKNLPGEASELVSTFDWTLNEECFRYSECSGLKSFVAADKAVWNVEYSSRYPNCTSANAWHFNAQRRDINLVGPSKSTYRYVACSSNPTW